MENLNANKMKEGRVHMAEGEESAIRSFMG